MNTKKTIQRNKRTRRLVESIAADGPPIGAFYPGCHDKEIGYSYARVMTNWPFLEDAMTNVLRSLLGWPPMEAAVVIFHTLIAQNTRIPIMRELLEGTQMNMDKPEVYDEILNEFFRLNGIRNKYTHRYWYTNVETGVVYLCDTKQDAHSALFTTREEINKEKLDDFFSQCETLRRRIFDEIAMSAPKPSLETLRKRFGEGQKDQDSDISD